MTDELDQELAKVIVDLIEYKKSYVAFVDVLGFKELISSNNTVKISIYYSIIKESIEKLSEILSNYGKTNFQIMSDSIVVAVEPTDNQIDTKILSLRALCAGVSHLQFHLAMEGIWLRGGISFGEIAFMDNQIVVGPALVSAYELEKAAFYPRVILDPSIYKDLNISRESLLEKVATPDDSMYRGQDWIFDWQKHEHLPQAFNDHLFVNFGVNLTPNFKFAREASLLIAQNWRREYETATDNFGKYIWLQNYFLALPIHQETRDILLKNTNSVL